MTKRHDIELMQYADGEVDLDPSELDAESRAKIESVGHVGEAVRGHLELHADAVPPMRFDHIWREIDKAIEADAAKAPAPAVAAPQASPSRSLTAAERPGAWGKVTRWLDKKLGYVITGVVSAGAVAAITLAIRPGSTTVVNGGGPVEPMPVVHRPAQIESLDTPGGTGTVMRIHDDDGDATVIWVTPEDIEEL